jgi:hypothetical protein
LWFDIKLSALLHRADVISAKEPVDCIQLSLFLRDALCGLEENRPKKPSFFKDIDQTSYLSK